MNFKRKPIPNLVFTMIAIFVVSSNATAGEILFVDDDAAAAGDGTKWATAYRFLQDALTDAEGGGISEIHVAQGTYKPDRDEAHPDGSQHRILTFHLINGVALMGGYAGIGDNNPNARDIELFETILSGDLLGNDEPDFVNSDDNSYHVTTGTDNDNTTLLEGFTITAGNANGAEDPNERGGGFYASPSDATINLCKFEANFCTVSGGGLYSRDGSLNLFNSTFVGNKVGIDSLAWGGGMFLSFSTFGTPWVDSCTFIGNSSSAAGAGLTCSGSFDDGVMISNCAFENNIAIGASNGPIAGAGMIVFNSSNEMQIANCTFINNSAINTTGWGIGGGLALASSNCRVVNCEFRGNSSIGPAGSQGGAIEVQQDNPQLVNCIAVGNNADFGGGFNNFSADATYLNCTFIDNAATNFGGAFRSHSNSEPLLSNCIMWGNGPDPIVDEGDAVTTVNYSNVQGGWAGAGSNNIDSDPMFVNPENGNYRLSSGSPSIDAGHNWYVPLDANDYDDDGILCELFPVDLDGNPRFNADDVDFDPGCGIPVVVDMGAYEYQFDPVDQITFADLTGDNAVSTADLLFLFASWGHCAKGCCLADLDLDGIVNTADLLLLFTNWGICK